MINVMQRVLNRALVTLIAPRLDAELADGQAPEMSPRHALRARQLSAPSHRSELAQAWERLLLLARAHPDGARLRVPIRRERVLRVEPEIRRVIEALRADGPVPAQGVAIARRLISDGTGPIYNPRAPDVLEELLGRRSSVLTLRSPSRTTCGRSRVAETAESLPIRLPPRVV